MLVYNDASRTSDQWKRHLMRVDSNGKYTGQWLFDAAILTTQSVNGKDIMYGQLNGADLSKLLDMLFDAAAQLDSAAAALRLAYGTPPHPIQIAIAMPWLNPEVNNLQLPGVSGTLNMGNPPDRITAASWYLDQIKSRAQAAGWHELNLYGAYYHREDASEAWGDPQYVQQFNIQAHNRGLSTVWVPYYDAPQAWNGAALGFDVVVVQPSYSFRCSLYEGEVNAGRLYSAGYKAAGQHHAIEYEASSEGQSQTENWIAHQYLAISQVTGASAYSQAFFVGGTGDMFDLMRSQAKAPGNLWQAYSDLANYLQGQKIKNMEIGLPWQPNQTSDGRLIQVWTPAQALSVNSVRLDFNDADLSNPWRGRFVVEAKGPGGVRTAYAQRSGSDDINPHYNSVLTPLPVPRNGNTLVARLTITMSRESRSPWPTVQRLVESQYEPTYIANGNYQETSTASLAAPAGTYSDSANTYLGYAAGKLTDGAQSPTGAWNWSGVMGWNMEDGRFSVTIDLGQSRALSSVHVLSHSDQTAGINWPLQLAATAADCPPHSHGIGGQSCMPTASSGASTLTSHPVTGSKTDYSGTIALPLSATGRYVTITGICSGWSLFDEVQVYDVNGTIVSGGKPYTVTPAPSVNPGSRIAYGDDSHKLVDGAIAPDFAPQFSDMLVGIHSNRGGSVQATWIVPHVASSATVWMTNPNMGDGVLLPSGVTIRWRNQNKQWQAGVTVAPTVTCGPSPCAQLNLPRGAQVTGVQATFPIDTSWPGWFMVSELSTQ